MAYPDDPALRASVTSLLGSAWPRVPQGIARAEAWGADWYEVSTPFVRMEGGVAVGHVGVLEMPLRVEGRDIVVAGVHGVCVHPEHRGRGHLREAMREALAWIDARHETSVLWTSEPEIYTRFGFARCEEQVFVSARPAAAGEGASRALSMDDPADLRIVDELLRDRQPVSERCAAREPGWLFKIDVSLWREAAGMLRFLPDLGCVVACDERGGALRVLDVIARRVPGLAEILARLGPGPDRVECYVTPDRLGVGLAAEPSPLVDRLMVRGRPLGVSSPFALSPLAHC
jgi:GNAT superfamily N-acetyltransferase